MVKTGRYRSEPVQESYCVLCKDWSIVNEKQFFLKFQILRNQ